VTEAKPGGKAASPGRQRGPLLALASGALFGVSAPLAKLLVVDAAPQLVAGLLYLGSGIGLAGVLGARRRSASKREASLKRADAPWLAGAIAFGGLLAPVLLMFGLARTYAASASLLLNLEGVFTALLAWFVFREHVNRRVAAGMALIVVGAAIVSWQGTPSWSGLIGPLMIVCACAAWAVDNNLTQRVSGGDPVQTAALKGIIAGTVNTLIALSLGAPLPSIGRTGAALVVGFMCYGMSLVLFILALRTIGTARTGAYFSVAPFIGAVVSVFIFRTQPTWGLLTAGALMLIGVYLHLTERHEHAHFHEPMVHAHAHVHDEHHRHVHSPDDPPVTDPVPHAHRHQHPPLRHSHPHQPDIHHRHEH
jgi:drug/metabolite transporter (DMT)-like permease